MQPTVRIEWQLRNWPLAPNGRVRILALPFASSAIPASSLPSLLSFIVFKMGMYYLS